MKIYIPKKAVEGLGGGWTFSRNLAKALRDRVEFVSDYRHSDIYFIPGCTLSQRDEVKKAKEEGKKVVLRVDNVPKNSRNRNTSTSRLYDFAQMADEVIYQSNWAKEWVSPFVKKDGVVILNGADTEIFRPDGDKMEKQGSPQWLYSRHNRDETKRWEETWYYFQMAYHKNPNVHLWVVGQFSDRNREYNFDFFGGAEKRYKYWGIVLSREEMAKMYRSADFLYVPYFMDACSNTVVEARLSGLKVIYNEEQGGGTKEIMEAPLEELTLKAMGDKYYKVFQELTK